MLNSEHKLKSNCDITFVSIILNLSFHAYGRNCKSETSCFSLFFFTPSMKVPHNVCIRFLWCCSRSNGIHFFEKAWKFTRQFTQAHNIFLKHIFSRHQNVWVSSQFSSLLNPIIKFNFFASVETILQNAIFLFSPENKKYLKKSCSNSVFRIY